MDTRCELDHPKDTVKGTEQLTLTEHQCPIQ